MTAPSGLQALLPAQAGPLPPLGPATIATATDEQATVTVEGYPGVVFGPYPIVAGLTGTIDPATVADHGTHDHPVTIQPPSGPCLLLAASVDQAWVLPLAGPA